MYRAPIESSCVMSLAEQRCNVYRMCFIYAVFQGGVTHPHPSPVQSSEGIFRLISKENMILRSTTGMSEMSAGSSSCNNRLIMFDINEKRF